MPNQTSTESKRLTKLEIKQFAASAGPCVTLMLPVQVPGRSNQRNLSARVKVAASQAEEKLAELSAPATLVRKLIDPIVGMAAELDDEAHAETLAVFTTETEVAHYWLPEKLDEAVVASSNPYVRPLIKSVEQDPEFYILALSQKDIRLLHCTDHSSEEVNLADKSPHSFHDARATDPPDHVLDNRSSPGPSSGASKGVLFGTTTEKEDKDEYLLHFYKQVNDGITELLKGQEKKPLVICGVEYELAIYNRVNTWPSICPGGVHGAPNGLKGGEMHARALECLAKMHDAEIDGLLAQHDKQAGEAATAGVNDIVKAAYEGRVQHLIAAENAPAMGSFDEATHRARTHAQARSGDEDMINAAAVQTLVHGGHVHMVPQSRVPGNRPMAAVMRY